ncbi:hypothetical protein Cni_G17920 [Canna indica]|uniref:YLP motif-containing protein 1 n=1 Tax=Canna indica TaxID=4628 RepID=A0AAQ3KNG8_9LILI|nr:hypothetical protein Cni_G17920 [Canna indica]
MDESWRFRPSQGHLCPVCSVPHFPFCPMPTLHAFDRYRPTAADFHRFPPRLAPPFPREPPFWNHRPPPPRMPYPPEPWGPHHAPEREPFPAINPPQRCLQDEFLGGETSHKRMRVEDPQLRTLQPPPSCDRHEFVPGRFSADDERRLNLIRDHGKQNAVEGLPQFSGEILPDKFGRDDPVNQYRDTRIDHGFDGPKFIERGDRMWPQELNFGPPNQFPRPNPFEEHLNFPEVLSSHGDERFVSHERLNFERAGASDSYLSDYKSAHYEKKDLAGDYPNVRHNHTDVSFQRFHNYRSGSSLPNSDYNATHATDKVPFSLKEQQTVCHTTDYVSQGQLKQYDCHDFQELPPKDSPYAVSNPRNSELGNYSLLRDAGGAGRNCSYPEFEDRKENRTELTSQRSEEIRVSSETKLPDVKDIQRPLKPANYPLTDESKTKNYVVQGHFPRLPVTNNNDGVTKEMQHRMHNSGHYPSLSTLSLPVGRLDPSFNNGPMMSSSPSVPPPALFPVLPSASAMTPVPANKIYPDPNALPHSSGYIERTAHPSTEIVNEDLTLIHQTPLKQYLEGGPKASMSHSIKIKPTILDACQLFKQPHRASRPDHIVVILRGLPGSGKSYLAKALRDLEIENGGNAPRIHAMDDYFMIEVEKAVEENEGSKSSGSARVKKQTTKKVIEYCYELEMEEVYRSSMLKAFKKTLEEGIFTFIIVDDRNLRVADFAQFWAIAKRSGYEVYLLEAPYKDPTGCAARNVHGFTLEDIQKMAEKWEEAPPLYLQLDIQSLFRGDNLNEQSIQEVDMDITDSDSDGDSPKLQNEEKLKPSEPKSVAIPDQDLSKVGDRWESEEEEEEQARVKELGNSKWSKDLDEDDDKSESLGGNTNALSGLIRAYSKGGKSVHWGDQIDKSGFSIGAMKKKCSLIIGPGAGYNLAANPLVEDQDTAEATESNGMSDSKRRFSEKLRAEHESFRVILNKRRQRIGGFFNVEDD